MVVKTIDLVHHTMGIHGKIIETDLKKDQNRFYEAVDATTPIDTYFEIIDGCIQHEDNCK